MSELMLPALQDENKLQEMLFLEACIAQHMEKGNYQDLFKISPQISVFLPETLWAKEHFRSFDGREIKFGVGVNWNDEQGEVRYECMLEYTDGENRLTLSSIDEAAKYFPREMLDDLTLNCLTNRDKKEEERKKRPADRYTKAPSSAVSKKGPRNTGSVYMRLGKKLGFKKTVSSSKRIISPAATMTAGNQTLCYCHDS